MTGLVGLAVENAVEGLFGSSDVVLSSGERGTSCSDLRFYQLLNFWVWETPVCFRDVQNYFELDFDLRLVRIGVGV